MAQNPLDSAGDFLSHRAAGSAGRAIYGNGKSGAFDLDGTNTYTGIFTKSGNVYTQAVDINFTTFRVRSGVTFKPNGWRRRGDTFTMDDGSILDRSGVDSSSSSGATAPAASANLFTSTNGGAGGTAAGAAGTANTQALGGSGGAGGTGSGGAGGAGGAATNAAAGTVGCDMSGYPECWTGITNKLASWAGFVGGCGGGGGGGDGTAAPGGGSGAPVEVMCARVISVAASAEVRISGGHGLSAPAGDRGGGGGGGGGLGAWVYDQLSFLGSLDVGGGVGGAGLGTGTAGSNGLAGTFYFIPNAE